MSIAKLTDRTIAACKPETGEVKLTDGGGLYLLVKRLNDDESGRAIWGRYWRWVYRFNGKQRTLCLGGYPEISLKEARERRAAAKRLLEDGIDPSEHKKSRQRQAVSAHSFEALAREWHSRQSVTWSPSYAETTLIRLEQNIFPFLGGEPIGQITAPMLLQYLRRVEERGAIETAHRIGRICSGVFRYAVALGIIERDPVPDLRGALIPMDKQNFATITDPQQIGELLRAIDGYQGAAVTRAALQLAPLVFVRPLNLRAALWAHIDLENALWSIPAEEMKRRQAQKRQSNYGHLVPLARQAVEIIRNLQPLTGHTPYLFPGVRAPLARPMSENTTNAALRRLGYEVGDMTTHGFRHMASTLLNEMGFSADAIERQLAHVTAGVRGVYNKAQYLDERRRMMQRWADYLDG